MAFKFGGNPFGASSAAFGAPSSASLFGGQSSASIFGGFGTPASSSASLFGSSSPAAFGAASSAGLFASSSGSLFGGASTGSLFGAQSSGASLFGSSSPSLFGATASAPQSGGLFSFNTASTPNLFGAQSSSATQGGGLFGNAFGQPAQKPALSSGGLNTTDNKPVTHYTRWEDISSQGQSLLLELEKRISETSEESRRLQGFERIQQGPHEEPGEAEATLRHGLRRVTGSKVSDEQALEALNDRIQELLHDTEQAVRTFQRAYTWREVAKGGQGQVISAGDRDLINSPIVLPSNFLEKCVKAFKENIAQYMVVVKELERLLPLSTQVSNASETGEQSFLELLPVTLRNNYEYILHVAAKLGKLQDQLSIVKERFLEDRHKAGEYLDPFREAERREQQSAWDAEQTRHKGIPPAQGNLATPTATSTPLLMASPSPQPGFGVAQQSGIPGFGIGPSNSSSAFESSSRRRKSKK